MLAHYSFVYNRKKKRLQKGEKALVQLRIWTEKKARYHSTGIYIESRYWNGKEPQWVIGCPNAKDYNDLLFSILTKVRSSEVKAIGEGNSLSHSSIDNVIQNNNSESFYDFMKNEIATRKDITEGTREQNEATLNKVKKHDLCLFSDLTVENITRVNNKMLENDKLSTVDKFHATVHAYINRAIKLDLFPIEKDPYLKFKRKRPKYVERKFITADELEQIETATMPVNRLDYIRDLFVFSCYTGLSFSDLQSLNKSNIVKDGDKLFIKTHRTKTNERASILLLPKATAILKKYDMGSDKCFRGITNETTNIYLKQIATVCKMEKNLTFHMARHTFATTVMLSQGVSLEVTQKALGHADIKTTQIYAKMLDNRIAEEMGKLDK